MTFFIFTYIAANSGSTPTVKLSIYNKGAFNNYVDKMRGGGGQKMFVFVHAQGIKTVHAGGGVKKWQNSVHVVVECPLIVRPWIDSEKKIRPFFNFT